MIKLVKFGLQQTFRGKLGFVFRNHGGGKRTTESVLDDFAVFGGAEQQPQSGVLVSFPKVAVESLEIKVELAEMFRLEPRCFQFNGHQAVESAMEEEQVERKILSTDLNRILRTHEAEVASQFSEKATKISKQGTVQIGFGMFIGNAQEFEGVGILEDVECIGM